MQNVLDGTQCLSVECQFQKSNTGKFFFYENSNMYTYFWDSVEFFSLAHWLILFYQTWGLVLRGILSSTFWFCKTAGNIKAATFARRPLYIKIIASSSFLSIGADSATRQNFNKNYFWLTLFVFYLRNTWQRNPLGCLSRTRSPGCQLQSSWDRLFCY